MVFGIQNTLNNAFLIDSLFWLSATFLAVIFIPILMIAFLAKRYSPHKKSSRIFWSIILFYLIYFSVVGVASLVGFFDTVMLPPKIIVFTTFPLLLFLVGIIFNLKAYRQALEAIPLEKLISLHIFRLIGSTFLLLMWLGFLPKPLGFIAGFGDIITAISSLWVARLVSTQYKSALNWAILWNTFGLVDILITSATAIMLTKISIETGAMGVEILASFPFCYIPAFAPATIIFLHLSIYRKVYSIKNLALE